MKVRLSLPTLAVVLLWSGAAAAQDPVKVDPAHYTVLLENQAVRVLRVDYAPGAKSAMHRHPDAIIVPLGDSTGRFTMADGKVEDLALTNEVAQCAPAVTHTPANAGTGRMAGILIEFKGKPGSAAIPSARADMGMKTLAECPHATVVRATADAKFHEPAGSKHEFDQIVIALGAAGMSLAIDGKPAKTKWARGDVQFIGRGQAHESKNTGGKPVDFIIVTVK
jgi:quercetin dioxygenase-like cupin family protein